MTGVTKHSTVCININLFNAFSVLAMVYQHLKHPQSFLQNLF